MQGETVRSGAATAERVAAAAVVVLARDGFDVLSVRTVAREAGLSGGAVQYHFATRSDLLLGAFEHTVRTITQRLRAADLTGPLPAVLGRLCREVLPLDEQRHRECAVWVALSAAGSAHADLAAEHERALSALTDVLTAALATARADGQLAEGIDPPAAARVLVAVVDGLTLHGIAGSRSPAVLTATVDAAIRLVLP